MRAQASSRHRDASIADRNDDRRDDEGNGLAAAFGARLPRRRRAQKAEAEAQFEEDSTVTGSTASMARTALSQAAGNRSAARPDRNAACEGRPGAAGCEYT